MPKCADCGKEATPSNVLYGGYGRLVCGDCLPKFFDNHKEKTMDTTFKSGFDFVIKFKEETKVLFLYRRNGSPCYCPYTTEERCGSHCPHFVIDNCNMVNKKCTIILTCGRHMARVMEIA